MIRQAAFIDDNKTLKGGLHCHTTRSDGSCTPEEVMRLHRENGYDFLALTDHKIYKGWTLRCLKEDKNFQWTAKTSSDWRNPPTDWIETKYQRKAIREGRKPVFLDFERL